MPLPEERSSRGSLTFYTEGDWSVGELKQLLAATEDLYRVFLSKVFWRDTMRQRRQALQGMPPSRLYRYLEDWGLPLVAIPPQDYLGFLHENISDLEPDLPLTIRSIEMKSPGFVSFQGLGEPIREIREFIKDIWYRNRQERQLGELEIARKHLELLQQADSLPGDADRLIIVAVKNVSVLEQLERAGKLDQVPERVEEDFPAPSDDS